jgi:hypothetical protein
MAESHHLELTYFQEQWALTQKMVEVVRYSFEYATPMMEQFESNPYTEITAEQSQILEALTARFARLTDILTQKVCRAIDALELVDEGSLLDRFNRMEKRDIANAEELVEMRKLRNRIAHDYALADLIQLHQEAFHHCDRLFKMIEALGRYVSEKGWNAETKDVDVEEEV